MTQMTRRQRMITALTNQKPDRVPIAPDISNMVPCRLTGKPFWEIYIHEDPPLWRAYLEAMHYFGLDGWFIYGDMQFRYENLETVEESVERRDDYWLVRYRHRTAAGDRLSTMRFGIGDSPVRIERPIRDIRADFDWTRAWHEEPVGYDPSLLREQRAALGEDGAFGICVDYPGLQAWVGWVADGLPRLVYWASWTYTVVEAARAAGAFEVTGRIAYDVLASVYPTLDRREDANVGARPGTSHEWRADDLSRTTVINETYGWGATTATLLLRHLFGFGPSQDTSRVAFELAPALQGELMTPGRCLGFANLHYFLVAPWHIP
jgi:hypothetical protein